jgi:predicted AAA+ superfamily ATPase
LRRIFVLEEIPAWAPGLLDKRRMRLSPKRFLVDPSLVVAALGSSIEGLLLDHALFGRVFEGLCLRDLLVYSSLMGAQLYHYHDYNDFEVDAIISLRDGGYAAVEIKLSSTAVDEAARSLTRFAAKIASAGAVPPRRMIVLTGDGYCHQRSDGIAVVPIACLKP